MTFLQKLTEDTIAGMWDDTWNYKDGSQTLSLIKTKHYLSGLTLSANTTNAKNSVLVFPNGVAVLFGKDELEKLRFEILVAIDRRVNKCVQDYLANVVPAKKTDKKDLSEPNDDGADEVR